ncbi:MAG: FAD-dependent oxidoreductase [Marinomonas sp.]
MSETVFDFAIVGAGMAGASLAAELAPHANVIVMEAEDAPGYHATGRSAAFWDECYGGPKVVPLTLASGDFLRTGGFLRQRGALHIARDEDLGALNRFMETFADTGATIQRLERSDFAARVPKLRSEWRHAIWEEACADIDVGALHAHYLGQMKLKGVRLETHARLANAVFANGCWDIACESGFKVRAQTIVNAAGAWADEAALKCGINPIGIQPMRRTVAQIRVSPPAPQDLPLVLDINGGFYFKSDNGRLWLSPHDETPSAPCDAAPEELDVANAIDRFQKVADWPIEHVERRWAGLRSFAPDRLPVYGRDLREPAFAWFAGQGGFGIQTAPAAARFMAQKLLSQEADAMTANICNETYDPARFG